MSDKFSITITAKVRHGKLWELRKKFGTTKALAEYLGITQSELGTWMNLKAIPKRMNQKRRDKLDIKLVQFGYLIEDLFPPALTKDVLDAPKEFEATREVSLTLLGQAGGIKLLNGPEGESEESELKQQISKSLYMLTPREEKVIRYRFGLDGEDEHTLQETGEIFEVNKERIRQIEAKAFRKLRHPSRSKGLKNFVQGVEERAPHRNVRWWMRYANETEIEFSEDAPIIGRIHSISVNALIVMFDAFAKSGAYIRISVNGVLEWAYRVEEKDIAAQDWFNRNQCMYHAMSSTIKIQKRDKISVEIGPIERELIKNKRMHHDIEIILTCAPIEGK